MKSFSSFVAEDAPANAAGGGAVAGIGVGPSGEPPKKKKPKIMKRLTESEDIKAHKIPFEKNPHIGWYKDKDHIVAYHGTHERNLHSVLKHGLTHKEEYESWKKKNPTSGDHEYYALSELRFNKEIPKHFVKGYMKKKDGGEH